MCYIKRICDRHVFVDPVNTSNVGQGTHRARRDGRAHKESVEPAESQKVVSEWHPVGLLDLGPSYSCEILGKLGIYV